MNGSHRKEPGRVLWLTGLSGAGKTTLATLLRSQLELQGVSVEALDGDVVRAALSPDLGFSVAERETHARRIAWVAQLLTRQGIWVIVSSISPARAVRDDLRSGFVRFMEIFVDAPLEECIRRDPKGLYRRALAGEIQHFTGIDARYEPPQFPELIVDTVQGTPSSCVAEIIDGIYKTEQPASRRDSSPSQLATLRRVT